MLTRGGLCTMQRDKADKEEGNENPVGLETVNESKGDAATMSGSKFENNDGNRVPMQCE